jgi:lysophospholipase L1-like esterase
MKRLLIPLICLTAATAVGQNIVYDTIRYEKKYYQKRVALFKQEQVKKHSVIFLGNSIAQFGDWKKLMNDSTVVNRGIAADNTFGVLDRLDDVIIHQPSKLFIEIGINDISQNIPANIIVKNILTIVSRVKAGSPGTKIYVHSILPTNDNVKSEYPDAFNKNPQIDFVNKQLKLSAKKNKFSYIDLSKELRDKNGDLDIRYANPDGLHLNEKGYETWVKLLKMLKR